MFGIQFRQKLKTFHLNPFLNNLKAIPFNFTKIAIQLYILIHRLRNSLVHLSPFSCLSLNEYLREKSQKVKKMLA